MVSAHLSFNSKNLLICFLFTTFRNFWDFLKVVMCADHGNWHSIVQYLLLITLWSFCMSFSVTVCLQPLLNIIMRPAHTWWSTKQRAGPNWDGPWSLRDSGTLNCAIQLLVCCIEPSEFLLQFNIWNLVCWYHVCIPPAVFILFFRFGHITIFYSFKTCHEWSLKSYELLEVLSSMIVKETTN